MGKLTKAQIGAAQRAMNRKQLEVMKRTTGTGKAKAPAKKAKK